MIIKTFYGREDRVAELLDEEDRVQYKNTEEDCKKVDEVLGLVMNNVFALEDKVDDYVAAMSEDDETEDNESMAGLTITRNELIEQWALAQASLSKFAWVLRIDGNEAFHRMLDSMKNRNTVDMSGL